MLSLIQAQKTKSTNVERKNDLQIVAGNKLTNILGFVCDLKQFMASHQRFIQN